MRTTVLASVILLSVCQPASATFHLWQIVKVFSNASGTVQYVELFTTAPGQQFLGGHTLTSSTNVFTFPSDLPGIHSTANQHVLIATSGYTALSGVPHADYVLDTNNLFSVNGDTLDFAGVSAFAFASGQLPADGIHQAERAFNSSTIATSTSSPTNFAGATGTIQLLSQTPVPNVVGLTQTAGIAAVTGAGLMLGTVTTASSNSVPAGTIISETPLPATLVNLGSAVNLVVSSGAPSGGTPSGSMAQIATAGGWDTLITLVNLGASTSNAHGDFYGNGGTPLNIPLNLVAPLTTTPAASSSIDQSLNSKASVVIDGTGDSDQPPAVGWLQLQSASSISGFGIFRFPQLKWEAAVPLETRNADSYFLAFDNIGVLATGVAVANVATSSANITVIIRDDSGTQIGTATLSLPAQGHDSFMLNVKYPATANKRGTIEFQTPQGGQISVLGLRANGGALTTLPVLANVGSGGGSIAHTTFNNGFTSVFYIVNTGSSAADFTLGFFNEFTGDPLTVPLSLPQSGTVTTTSALTRTLAAGAMLVVETQTQDSAGTISASALLTATGNIRGFEVFRWTTFGQEASVPLETRTDGSFVLAFDNTNGLTTGLALANQNPAPANTTIRIYDDAGVLLQSSVISLAGRGHTSFMLPDNFPVTASRHGIAEFVVPTGGKISVIGLRAKADGTLTTIPVLGKGTGD